MPVIFKLAYETAVREHDRQQQVLDSLRTRSGVILSAASVAGGFLGSQAITDGPDPRGWIAAAITAYLLGGFGCTWLLLPRGAIRRTKRNERPEHGKAFEFDHDILSWLTAPAWTSNGEGYAYEHVARSLHAQRLRNVPRLDRMFNTLLASSLALAASLGCWLIALGGR
jgi:hypothetical protein